VICSKCKKLIEDGRSDVIRQRLKREKFFNEHLLEMDEAFQDVKKYWQVKCHLLPEGRNLVEKARKYMNYSPYYGNGDILWGIYHRWKKYRE